jgi:uncharacterized membrane protein YdjX (TVP38/TMEM64 family)
MRLKVAGQIAFLAIGLGVGAVWLLPHRGDIAGLQDLLQHHRAAPLIFLLLHMLASLLFLPRTAMAAVAGLVFGVWWGAVLAALGSVIGAVAGFLIARYINNGMVSLNEMRRIGGIVRRLEDGGWRAVAMLRLVPLLPHTALNYAMGLTDVRLLPYAFGSLIGQLPLTLAFVQFGSAGGHLLDGKPDWIVPTIIGVAALGLSTAIPRLFPQLRRSGSAPNVASQSPAKPGRG